MIPREIEATFINIDKDTYRAQLRSLGAELISPEVLMRRTVFDVDDHSFIRVRDEGPYPKNYQALGNCQSSATEPPHRITMSYKSLASHTLSGMGEICLEVSDYAAAVDFLKAAGHRVKAYQESYRETWLLDGVEITLDTWPWLPPYTELEGPSEASVRSVAAKLGFDMTDAIFGSVDEIYKIYYDVTERDVNYAPDISFGPVPAWLEGKERK